MDVLDSNHFSRSRGKSGTSGEEEPAKNIVEHHQAISKQQRAMEAQAVITGTEGNDNLIGTPVADSMNGLGGDDLMEGRAGADTLDGGLGNDMVVYNRSSSGVRVNLTEGKGYGGEAESDRLFSIEGVVGSPYDDLIVGNVSGMSFNKTVNSGLIAGNLGTRSTFKSPSVSALVEGGFVVAWHQYILSWDIYVQRLDAGGRPLGNPLAVAKTAYDEQFPSISGLTNGGFVVAWQDPSAGNWNIYAQRYDSDGNVLGSTIGVATTGSTEQNPSISYLPNGGFVVVWQSDNGYSYAQRYNNDGNKLGSTTVGVGLGQNPSISYLRNGGFVVAWQRVVSSNWDIYAQRYDSDGNTVGSTIGVATTGYTEMIPSISYLSNGGFVVAWQRYVSNWDIYAQRYDSDGNALGGPISVAVTDNHEEFPVVSEIANGGFVIAWQMLITSTNTNNIYAQSYDANGNPVGALLSIATSTNDEFYPAVAGPAMGGFITAFTVRNASSGMHEVWFKQYLPRTPLSGNQGNDQLISRQAMDVLDGGPGIDTVIYNVSSSGVTVNLNTGTGIGGEAEGDTFINIENVIGSPYEDTLIGNDQDNVLTSGGGSYDRLTGLGGKDTFKITLAPQEGVVEITDFEIGKDKIDLTEFTNIISYDQLSSQKIDDTTIQMNDHQSFVLNIKLSELNGSSFLFKKPTATLTPSSTRSHTETRSTTHTHSAVRTSTASTTLTAIPTHTQSLTGTSTQTNTITAVNTRTPTQTNTPSISDTKTQTHTGLNPVTGTDTPTYTLSSTQTPSNMVTKTPTRISTVSSSPTETQTQTRILSKTYTASTTFTDSPTETLIPTQSFTETGTESITATLVKLSILSAVDGVFIGTKEIEYIVGQITADTVSYSDSPAAVQVDLLTGKGAGGNAEKDVLQNINNIIGSLYGDLLSGNNLRNILEGKEGDDILEGRGSADIINGGLGINTASYASSPTGVKVNLGMSTASGGDAEGDTLIQIQNLQGSQYDDVFVGSEGANRLSGMQGNDFFEGKGGADLIDGGEGSDTASYENSPLGVKVDLQATGSVTAGDAEGDTLKNIENLIGSPYSDGLFGNQWVNTLNGQAGDDTLVSFGDDDTLIGGEGIDKFRINGNTLIARIEDFDPGYESIDLSAHGISYSDLQKQEAGADTLIRFGNGGKLLIKKVQSALLKESNFIFSVSIAATTWKDEFEKYAKILTGPVASVFSTGIAVYFKLGLIKNILFVSCLWKGNSYKKKEVWTPQTEHDTRMLTDRNGDAIKIDTIEKLSFFGFHPDKKEMCLQSILPRYLSENARGIFMDHPLLTRFGTENAFIRLNQDILRTQAIDFETISVRVIAKNGEILEQFGYTLNGLMVQVNSPTTSLIPSRGVKIGVSPNQKLAIPDAAIEIESVIPESSSYAASSVSTTLFLTGTFLYRLPALYDHLKYLLRTHTDLDATLSDLDTFIYNHTQVSHLSQHMSTILRPTIVLSGASLAYQQSADPLVLVVAMSQPDFGIHADSVWMDMLYYMTAVGCITRLGAMMRHPAEVPQSSLLVVSLMLAEGSHLVGHFMADMGLVSEDSPILTWMQPISSFAINGLGMMLHSHLPLKIIQGIELVTQGIPVALKAWEASTEYFHHLYEQAQPESESLETFVSSEEISGFISDWA